MRTEVAEVLRVDGGVKSLAWYADLTATQVNKKRQSTKITVIVFF
jgi:hypothetical protein